MALIVEVLGRDGEVRLRRELGEGPLTIGRGYDNDVVLDDPYADARHARVVRGEDGAPVLEDLGSVNALGGLDGRRVRRLVLQPGTEVRVGRTRVRFRDPEAPLPPALRDVPAERLRLPVWLTRPWAQLGVCGVAAAVTAWDAWSDSYRDSGASAAFYAALGFVLLISLWAGIWAVAGRVAAHRARFFAHVAIVSAVVIVSVVYSWVAAWITFLFPDNPVSSPLGEAIGAVLLAVLLTGHLRLASGMPPRRRWITGLAVAVGVVVIGWASGLPKRKEFSDVPTFPPTLKPFPAAWVPTGDLRSLRDVAVDLRRKVDALRTTHEIVRERPDDGAQ